MNPFTSIRLAASFLFAVTSTAAFAQVMTNIPPPVAGARAVTIQHIKVHAPSIERNLEGESADRDVLVVLPPSYATDAGRRYPVLYALHGYSIGAEQWTKEIHVPQTIEGAFAKGAREMIVVFPDAKTIHNGSMYSSSATTGDFETFIARDLIRYIDEHYRTIPDPLSRGLAGHSMGGYGTAFGAVIGSAFLEVIRNALLMAGIDSNWQGAFVGMFIVIAVLLGMQTSGTSLVATVREWVAWKRG